ncbi:MAG: cell division FtsA domain-containing protein, partial [bacterium]
LEGMRGTKLEIKAFFVTYSIQHLEDMVEAVAQAGVDTIDVIASPISGSQIALSEKQKIVGVALVSIGHQTTSLAVFENGLPIAIHTFSIGSSDITNDIALGLKIPLMKAEGLKMDGAGEEFSARKLDEIVEARLSDIFELIENHLKKIKRSGLLPAGIVFVGGGANTKGLLDLSKIFLKLPTSMGETEMFGNTKTKLRDSAWFTALGLIMGSRDNDGYSEGSFINLIKDLKRTIKSSIKQLMP